MLKKYEVTFAILQRFIDLSAGVLAFALAYWLRFYSLPIASYGIDSEFYLQLIPVLVVIQLYFFERNGLYNSQRFQSRIHEILAILKANSQTFVIFLLSAYFLFSLKVSRLMMVQYFIFSYIILIIVRISFRNFLRYLRRQGYNLRHLLLIGSGPQVEHFVREVRSYPDAGIRFVGWGDGNPDVAKSFKIPVVDADIEKAKKLYRPDGIVVGYKEGENQKVLEILREHHNDVIPIQVLPDISYAFVGYTIDDFAGIPIITLNAPPLTPFDHLLKRAVDILLTGVGLIALSPLLILLGLLVKLTSKGPIFYGQERMGLDGHLFNMWKFRSMKTDAEVSTGAVWAVENDPRRTVFGTFLRSSSLDELPQLWNVFVGDMSLVGPRPERPVFVEKFRDEIPQYMLRHKMKSGVTGWAQVQGWRGNTSLHKRIECDLFYIKNWSLWFDLKIIFLTFWKGLFNKNAY